MIYIQTPNGLTQISSQLTKEKIIAALGYTPADNASFYEDESGALVIADEKGYIIARIDETGFKTTKINTNAIALNGEDLAEKLQALADKVPDIDLTGYATEEYVNNAIDNINIPNLDLSAYALAADVEANKVLTDAHAADKAIHVTQSEKYAWDAKSNFSGNYSDLSNAPNIEADTNDNELIVSDAQGNVIMKVNAYGINTTAVYINGKLVSFPEYTSEDEGKVLRIVDGAPAWVALTPAEEVLF